MAFLGAGASAPLYPLWGGLIGELVDAAADRLTPAQVATCEALASSSPDAVVEVVRRSLGAGVFREALRQVLRARSDPETGPVVDGGAGAGVPVRVQGRGDHQL